MQAEQQKKILATEIAKLVENNQIIGLGTGSTVSFAIAEIAKKIKSQNLNNKFLSSSKITTAQALQLGLNVLPLETDVSCDWGFDGADYVDAKRNVVKGKGGAFLLEKVLALKCLRYIIISDSSKLVSSVFDKAIIPIEIVPSSTPYVITEVQKLGAKQIAIRQGGTVFGPVYTENGNYILDAEFSDWNKSLAEKLKNITGVVETGIFLNIATSVWVCDDVKGEIIRY